MMFTHRNPEALGGGEFFARVVFRIIHSGLTPKKDRIGQIGWIGFVFLKLSLPFSSFFIIFPCFFHCSSSISCNSHPTDFLFLLFSPAQIFRRSKAWRQRCRHGSSRRLEKSEYHELSTDCFPFFVHVLPGQTRHRKVWRGNWSHQTIVQGGEVRCMWCIHMLQQTTRDKSKTMIRRLRFVLLVITSGIFKDLERVVSVLHKSFAALRNFVHISIISPSSWTLQTQEFVDDLAMTSMARLWDVGKSEPIKVRLDSFFFMNLPLLQLAQVGKASPTEGTLPGSIYIILKSLGARQWKTT